MSTLPRTARCSRFRGRLPRRAVSLPRLGRRSSSWRPGTADSSDRLFHHRPPILQPLDLGRESGHCARRASQVMYRQKLPIPEGPQWPSMHSAATTSSTKIQSFPPSCVFHRRHSTPAGHSATKGATVFRPATGVSPAARKLLTSFPDTVPQKWTRPRRPHWERSG